MIIFDTYTYVADIVKNGILENDNNAYGKLLLVAKYLITNTKYKPSRIKEKMRKCAEEYFRGLPDPDVNKEIEIIFGKAKVDLTEAKELEDTEIDYETFVEKTNYFEPKHLVLYENEMKMISELDKNLQELAFVFLVVHKFQGHKWTYECNADIYRLCHWDEKGKGKSQTTKDNLIHRLVEKDILSFYCKTNKAYDYNKAWIAKMFFTVLINEDYVEKEKRSSPWKTITNYDDILLYWKLYKGENGVKLCEKCEAPIEDTGNAKKYCSKCAIKKIKESKKHSKERALKTAG